MLVLLIQMREKNIHKVIESGAPIGVDPVFSKSNGQAFHRKDYRRMIVSQLMNESAVLYAFAVIQNAVIDVFTLKMFLHDFLELGQRLCERLGVLPDEIFQRPRQSPQLLMVRC